MDLKAINLATQEVAWKTLQPTEILKALFFQQKMILIDKIGFLRSDLMIILESEKQGY